MIFPDHTWKLAAVREYVGDQRPLAWIDDQIGDDVKAWAQTRTGPTALMSVSAGTGILPEKLDELEAWLDRQPAGVTFITKR